MSEVRIAAERRTEFGKGAARRIRRAAKVPAVLYGHGTAPRHLALPGHELMRALRTPNVLLGLELEDGLLLALPKDVQRDPLKGSLEHVDLVIVERGEKVRVAVPLAITGEVAPGGLLNHDLNELEIEAEATHLPESIPLNVDGMEVGHHVVAKDVPLPAGATLATDPETLVLTVTAAPSLEQLEADLAQAEADLGVVHETKTEDALTPADATPAEQAAG